MDEKITKMQGRWFLSDKILSAAMGLIAFITVAAGIFQSYSSIWEALKTAFFNAGGD